MSTRKKLEDRTAAIEAELDRRVTPSQRQAAYAIRSDRREVDDDDREDAELSTSERQARSFLERFRRGGWATDGGD